MVNYYNINNRKVQAINEINKQPMRNLDDLYTIPNSGIYFINNLYDAMYPEEREDLLTIDATKPVYRIPRDLQIHRFKYSRFNYMASQYHMLVYKEDINTINKKYYAYKLTANNVFGGDDFAVTDNGLLPFPMESYIDNQYDFGRYLVGGKEENLKSYNFFTKGRQLSYKGGYPSFVLGTDNGNSSYRIIDNTKAPDYFQNKTYSLSSSFARKSVVFQDMYAYTPSPLFTNLFEIRRRIENIPTRWNETMTSAWGWDIFSTNLDDTFTFSQYPSKYIFNTTKDMQISNGDLMVNIMYDDYAKRPDSFYKDSVKGDTFGFKITENKNPDASSSTIFSWNGVKEYKSAEDYFSRLGVLNVLATRRYTVQKFLNREYTFYRYIKNDNGVKSNWKHNMPMVSYNGEDKDYANGYRLQKAPNYYVGFGSNTSLEKYYIKEVSPYNPDIRNPFDNVAGLGINEKGRLFNSDDLDKMYKEILSYFGDISLPKPANVMVDEVLDKEFYKKYIFIEEDMDISNCTLNTDNVIIHNNPWIGIRSYDTASIVFSPPENPLDTDGVGFKYVDTDNKEYNMSTYYGRTPDANPLNAYQDLGNYSSGLLLNGPILLYTINGNSGMYIWDERLSKDKYQQVNSPKRENLGLVLHEGTTPLDWKLVFDSGATTPTSTKIADFSKYSELLVTVKIVPSALKSTFTSTHTIVPFNFHLMVNQVMHDGYDVPYNEITQNTVTTHATKQRYEYIFPKGQASFTSGKITANVAVVLNADIISCEAISIINWSTGNYDTNLSGVLAGATSLVAIDKIYGKNI